MQTLKRCQIKSILASYELKKKKIAKVYIENYYEDNVCGSLILDQN